MFRLSKRHIKEETIMNRQIKAVVIFLLSMCDLLTTLVLFELGAQELNPFMAWLLTLGTPIFIGVKVTMSFFGCLAMSIWNRDFAATFLLNLTLAIYSVVVCLNIFLLTYI